MHDMENDRKSISWKMIEKSHLENDRMENAYPENDRKITHWKMTDTSHLENERMENA